MVMALPEKGSDPATEKSKRLRSPPEMFHFLCKRVTAKTLEKDVVPVGYTQPESADELLSVQSRRKLIDMIWQRTSLSNAHFERLYLAPIRRYANLVQLLPASQNHHHAYPGGMLDHGLEIIVYALKLRQSHLLPPGATPEDQAAQEGAWTAGLAYAALLHDIGKIVVDQHVQLASGSTWHAWNGPINEPYRIRFVSGRDYQQHPAAGALIALQVLPPDVLDWLAQTPSLFRALTYVLSGHYDQSGILGELVIKADQASVSKALGGNPEKAIEAPKESLQGKLIMGLRHLVKNELRLNQPGASGWLTSEALWLVSKSVTDLLKAHLLGQGVEGIPHRNSRLFDEMQSHGIIQPTAADMAIWNCTITDPDRNWHQKLTMIKVAPALIWGTESRPEAFTGTVQVSTDQLAVQPAEHETASQENATEHVGKSAATIPLSDLPPQYDDDELAQLMSNAGACPPPLQGELLSIPVPDFPHEETWAEAPHEPELLQPTPMPSIPSADLRYDTGMHFVYWLKSGLKRQTIVINDVKAKVHTVDGTAFIVTPGIFQRYVMEHPQSFAATPHQQAWKDVQKQFQKLRLHTKTESGLNIWKCTVCGQRRTRKLQGYLLQDPATLFAEIPCDNPYLSLDQGDGPDVDI